MLLLWETNAKGSRERRKEGESKQNQKNKIRIRVFTSARSIVTGAMTTGHLVCKGPAGQRTG